MSGIRNDPPISTSSPRDTTASPPRARALRATSSAPAALFTTSASSAPVSSTSRSRRGGGGGRRPPAANDGGRSWGLGGRAGGGGGGDRISRRLRDGDGQHGLPVGRGAVQVRRAPRPNQVLRAGDELLPYLHDEVVERRGTLPQQLADA